MTASRTGAFLILGGVKYVTPAPGCDLVRMRAYRGVERATTHYPEGFPESHEVHAAFRDSFEWADRPGIERFEDAARVCAAYQRAMPDAGFEVIEIVEPGARPTRGRERLGVDITDPGRNYSHIAESILHDRAAPPDLTAIQRTIWPLAGLVHTHFRALLNRHILFEREETAQACLECINALQTLSPGFYETGTFGIVAVFACEIPTAPPSADDEQPRRAR